MANINLPKGRDLASEYSQTLSAQANILPNLLATQAQYAPLTAANQLSQMQTMLLGTPGGSYETRSYTPPIIQKGNSYRYGAVPKGFGGMIDYPDLPQVGAGRTPGSGGGGSGGGGGLGIPGLGGSMGGGGLPGVGGGGIDGGVLPGMNGIPGMGGGGGFPGLPGLGGIFGGGDTGPHSKVYAPGGYTTTEHTMPAQRGLLDIYTKDVAPTLEKSQEGLTSSQRSADIADVSRLGPQALQAIMQSDPASAKLIEQLTGQATSQLGMGAQLDPSLMRLAQQSVRARQTGMLGGTGNAGSYGEALGLSQFGQGLRQQRIGNANQVVQLRNQIYGDPFQRILGRPNAGLGPAAGAVGQAGGMASSSNNAMSLLNPESSYAQDIYSGNWNALVNQAIGNANNKNALIGAGISSLGSIAGGAAGMI